MNRVKDQTGRFAERPYYEAGELDGLSEDLVTGFLRERHGKVEFPISTEDLTVLVECHTSNLDQYADLSSEGADVEGMTLFYKDKSPEVKISERLGDSENRDYRRRTTLTHELGHVKLHSFLWQFDQLRLFPEREGGLKARCHRVEILGSVPADWMEWQAGYVSGAMLMPVTPLKRLVGMAFKEWGVFGGVAVGSGEGADLIRRVMSQFGVSQDAARVRLAQLGFIADQYQGQSLYQK